MIEPLSSASVPAVANHDLGGRADRRRRAVDVHLTAGDRKCALKGIVGRERHAACACLRDVVRRGIRGIVGIIVVANQAADHEVLRAVAGDCQVVIELQLVVEIEGESLPRRWPWRPVESACCLPVRLFTNSSGLPLTVPLCAEPPPKLPENCTWLSM